MPTTQLLEAILLILGRYGYFVSSSSSPLTKALFKAFFDQKLITEVTKIHPYSSNTQQLLPNAQDSIFAQEANSMDPVYNYVYLGNGPQDGILAWITIGINPNNRRSIMVAADWTANGGVPANGGGFPGFPPVSTTTPTPTSTRTTTAVPTSTTLPTTGPVIQKFGQW